MKIGSLSSKAPSLLSWFVISCAIVITGLLYVMQKTQATTDNLASEDTTLQTYLGS